MTQRRGHTPRLADVHIREIPSHMLGDIADGRILSVVTAGDARLELDRRLRQAQELTCLMLDRFSEVMTTARR